MTPIDDPLNARLRASDPASKVTMSESDLDDLLQRAKTPRHSRRGAVVVGAGVIAVLAVSIGAVPAAAAVVDHFFAQTGWFGDSPNPGGQSAGPAGEEYIDLLAPDTRDYILTQYPAYIPTPPGRTRAEFKEEVADQIIGAARQTSAQNDGVGVTEHAILVQRSFESAAYNDWLRTWVEADKRGDTATKTEAARVLRAACEWPAIVKTDGGGIVTLMQHFAHAAETSDLDGVQAAAQYNAEGHPERTGWDGVNRDWWLKKYIP